MATSANCGLHRGARRSCVAVRLAHATRWLAHRATQAQTLTQEPACQALTPAAAGGPTPKAQDVVVVRWLGTTNYELTYRGNVFLLDAYYDRVPKSHSIGVAAKDITKAHAVFIGHAHFDHIADAAAIARQTGATVVGARSAGDVVSGMGVSAAAGQDGQGRRGAAVRRCDGAGRARPPRRHRHDGAGGPSRKTAGGASGRIARARAHRR